MDSRKKQLKEQYRQRTVLGGIWRYYNTQNGRYLLKSTDDIKSVSNSHDLIVKNGGGCPMPRIRKDWDACGGEAFRLEVLDQLEKRENQTMEEYREDLKALLEMWQEKMDPDLSY